MTARELVRRSGRIDVAVRQDEVVITMQGDIDFVVTTEFDLVQEMGDVHDVPVRVDLSTVTFLDSQGIAQLLAARNYATEVRLVSPPPPVRRLLELSGITHLFAYDAA
ncbi:STAS domain-containing protein [Jatrophihabitans fulvus]